MLNSQTVRDQPYDPSRTNNPTGLTSDILALHAELSGSGAPDPSLGKIGDTYFDLLTTFNYQKNSSGVWEPTYSISASLPPPVIPDPLLVGELQTDTIKGKTSDTFTLDAGLNGDINVSLGATNIINIGSGSASIQGNGVITSFSPIIGYEIVSDNTSGKQILLSSNTSELNLIGPDPYVVQATNLGSTLTVKTNDANLTIDAGTGTIEHGSLSNFNPNGLSTPSINNSQALTFAKVLTTNHSGVMLWGEPPETAIFNAVNVGNNGTTYLTASSLGVNPADVSVYPVLIGNTFIRRVEIALMSSAGWSWGGVGTATMEFGTISTGLPCTAANWIPLFNLPLTVIGDYYFSLAYPNVNVGGGSQKLGVRLVAAGTSATNFTAEIVVKIVLSS